MPTCAADNPVAPRRLVGVAATAFTLISILLTTLFTSPPTHAAPLPVPSLQEASIPVRNPDLTVRLAGETGLLSALQFRALNLDLQRLARLGTESIVYIRDANDEATAQPWFAEDLRIGWGVESQAGARDGLVIVVSIDPNDPTSTMITTSAGANTFPIRRLTADGFDHLVADHALPQVQTGDTFGGLQTLLQATLGTVVDQASVLTERQLQTLDGDLRRLGEMGLPLVVYLQPAGPDAESGSDLATRLLGDWNVESAPGADDGVVLVVTVDEGNPESSTMTYAAGANAFPIRQLTADEYAAIIQEEALPQVQAGDTYLGLAFAIRRAINYAEYSPPEPAPLTEVQQLLQSPLNILAAVLVQVAAFGYVLAPALSERRLTLIPTARSMTVYVIVTMVLAIVVGALGVLGHNRVATLAGLAVFLWAIVMAPLIRAALIEGRNMADRRRSPTSAANGGVRVP